MSKFWANFTHFQALPPPLQVIIAQSQPRSQGLMVMPVSARRLNSSRRILRCSSHVRVWTRISSQQNSTFSISLSNFLIPRFSVAAEFTMPKAILKNSYEPFGVTKAVLGISTSSIVTCQYPLLKSLFENNLSSFNFCDRSTGGWRRGASIRNRKRAQKSPKTTRNFVQNRKPK